MKYHEAGCTGALGGLAVALGGSGFLLNLDASQQPSLINVAFFALVGSSIGLLVGVGSAWLASVGVGPRGRLGERLLILALSMTVVFFVGERAAIALEYLAGGWTTISSADAKSIQELKTASPQDIVTAYYSSLADGRGQVALACLGPYQRPVGGVLDDPGQWEVLMRDFRASRGLKSFIAVPSQEDEFEVSYVLPARFPRGEEARVLDEVAHLAKQPDGTWRITLIGPRGP